jgi:hypothetical protein
MTTKNQIEYDAACQMFRESNDIVVFMQTIVALCLRGNEYARQFLDEIIRYRRDHHIT